MTIYVVTYSVGWPEDGEATAGVYSTRELAEAAAAKSSVAFIEECELDAEPVYIVRG